jgi:hypothetical protein
MPRSPCPPQTPPSPPFTRLHLLASLAAAALLLAAGCTHPTDDVASLDGLSTAAGADLRATQREGAEALHSCLAAANLPVELVDREDGSAEFLFTIEGHDIVARFPNGTGVTWEGKTGTLPPELSDDELWASRAPDEAFLWIDGTDHSEVFAECWDKSGYVDPQSLPPLPADELLEKQKVAAATNDWIACARDHGLNGIDDVTATADGWSTYPEGTIPLSTSTELLRTVLESCPNFNEDEARRLADPETDVSDWNTRTPDPHLRIAPPPEWEDSSSTPTAAPEGNDNPDVAHYAELNAILDQESRAFWDTVDSGITYRTVE